METTLPLCTSNVTQEVAIRQPTTTTTTTSAAGGTDFAKIPPRTVMQNFDAVVAKYGNKPALNQKINGVWKSWTWAEYRAEVDAFAKSLLSLGFAKFDAVNMIGFNAPEWFMCNFGAIAAGGVAAGIYTTNNPEACQYVVSHCNAKVVVCEGVKQLEKFYGIAKGLPALQALVVYGSDALPTDIKDKISVPVYTFDDFKKLGKDVPDSAVQERSNGCKPGETCTLIYTSGTTGPPKGVMITNDNITWTVRAMLQTTRKGKMDHTDRLVSYLPLSHIAAQMLDMHMPMESGCQIYFAQPDALKGSLVTTLKEVRPTTFFGVPRVWEKMYAKLQEISKASTGVKKKMSTWAKKQAALHWESLEYGNPTNAKSPAMYFLAKKLLHKAHVALGLDRCYAFYVSAAPIEVKILKYFMSLDIPIMELFGMSECTGPHTVNMYNGFKVGTVGRPLLGTETKIDKDTGELCYRGRHIFAGYMKMEDKTDETIDADGWLHSGDIAVLDKDNHPNVPPPSGFMSITGRIKELIITAGGENVPPVLIEDHLKEAMPALSNAMVIGDKRNFLTVLLCLLVEVDDDGVASNKLTGMALETSKEIGSDATTTIQARTCPKWKEYFDNGLKTANAKSTSRAQQVGKWALLDTDFTEKGTELTPTLKLKRSVATEKYKNVIDALYA